MRAGEVKAVLFLAGLMSSLLPADEEVQLPDWNEEELEALESGDYVPGSSLLGEMAREILDSEDQEVIELDPLIRDLPDEEPISVEWTRVLRDEFVPAYFHEVPGGFLMDPQELLTTQEYRDRDGFLNYHARDTEIDCYLYLFDGPQELPEGESLESLVKSQFDPEKPAAIVFYYLGDPARAQLAFTDKVIEAVSEEERAKVRRMAIEEALEMSDPSSQLDSFSVQLSIRLYWLEKVVAKGGGTLLAAKRLTLQRAEQFGVEKAGIWEQLMKNEALFYWLMIAGILLPAAILGLLGRWIAGRKRVYIFPDAEGSPMLEAPHAAGVGGVLSFASATAPPSSQKREVPDYLQKM